MIDIKIRSGPDFIALSIGNDSSRDFYDGFVT